MAVTDALTVDPTNAGQLEAWDGDEGTYWAEHADRFDRSVSAHHETLLAAAAVAGTEQILDIGCGAGRTTLDVARAAAGGSALGVDLSAPMLDVARRRAAEEGVANASFERADAQVHPFPTAFDLVVSRTGAMFFGDPVAAFANVGRATVAGGRLVLVVWQPPEANEWFGAVTGALAAGRDLPAPPPGAPGPFALSDRARVRAVLTAGGFADVELEGTSAGMWFGDDADDAHGFVLGLMGWLLDGLDGERRARAVEALRATMAAHETAEGVVFGSATWTIRARRP